ncbi:DUF3109 family protein [Weeksellaceae bacterium KMM 9713]|uniref:DUF3109 family protein n=1 Tax=Profundicola chukchiensis TaxID=2961959 RepID=A0A9X4MY02_9FLAO|nr:DUF3109 family protein [Profundicola chukchiensis]MDG4944852.1 DUF3109 family protein [Profundicola chukchiensis]
MIQIDDTIISTDILRKEFVCNIQKCKGICCVEGDSGAPLDEEELPILEDIFSDIKPFLRPEGIKAIEEQGTYVKDDDGDWVTPLVDGAECAYVIFDEKGITKCGIEKAYEEGATDFQKPISCHLYPVRVDKYKAFTAVNYHKWDICSDACTLGQELNVTVAEFLKEPLIKKFGQEWYDQLMIAKDEVKNFKLF